MEPTFFSGESGFLQKRGIEPVADQLIGTVEHKGDDQCGDKGHDHRSDPADLTEDTVQMGHSQKDHAGIGNQQKVGLEFLGGHR